MEILPQNLETSALTVKLGLSQVEFKNCKKLAVELTPPALKFTPFTVSGNGPTAVWDVFSIHVLKMV